MASDLEYVKFIADQLSEAGVITYRKMFGEYGIYCDGKYFAAVCDNRFLVKITKAGQSFMPDCRTELPYEGARSMFLIEELDDREFLKILTLKTCAELPAQKPKKEKPKI